MDRPDRKDLPSEAGSLNEAGMIAGNWRWRRLTRNELDIQKPFSAGGSEIRPYRIRVVRWGEARDSENSRAVFSPRLS